MSETKTFVFPENGSFGGNSGVEGALIGSMLGGGGAYGGGMWNNPIWAIVFLAALRNGGIFGNDNNGGRCQMSAIQDQLQSIQGQNSLMSAITGGTSEIRSLANTINCDVNAVQSAINAVQSAICNVGNQVGMGQMQIINSVQSGNTAIANQIAQCCCDNKLLVQQQGYENRINNIEQSNMITKGFGDVQYATQAQTNALAQNNDANTRSVLAKLDQIEDSRKDREIASLTAALTAANSRAERAAELAPITQKLNDIMCKQPNTVTVPYQPFVTVPNCVAYNALYSGFPYANGGQFG